MAGIRSVKNIILLALLAAAAALAVLTHGYWREYLAYKFSAPPPSGTGIISAEKIDPDRIIIPKIGVNVPVIHVEERNEDAFQQGLRSGAVHYPGTAEIGQAGNAFIFGHSSDYIWAAGDYKTALALLPELKKGDLVIASDRDGNKFEYIVRETAIVDPSAVEYMDQHEYRETLLTLQTSYPVGTALKRFLVIAELKN